MVVFKRTLYSRVRTMHNHTFKSKGKKKITTLEEFTGNIPSSVSEMIIKQSNVIMLFIHLFFSIGNVLYCMGATEAVSLCIEYVWIQMQTLSMSAQVQKTFDWRQYAHRQNFDTMDDVLEMSSTTRAYWWEIFLPSRKEVIIFMLLQYHIHSPKQWERMCLSEWVCQFSKRDQQPASK